MVEREGDWAATIGLASPQAAAFEAVATGLEISPQELLRLLAERVVETDAELRGAGLKGIGYWATGTEAVRVALDTGLDGLPTDLRETGFMWPADKPFPWTAEECKAAVIGYGVRWRGEFDDFNNRLRGSWEMSDGYAFLLQR